MIPGESEGLDPLCEEVPDDQHVGISQATGREGSKHVEGDVGEGGLSTTSSYADHAIEEASVPKDCDIVLPG